MPRDYEFSSQDYAQMHYFYGYACGNASLAARMFRDYLQRRGGRQPETYPDHRAILRVHRAYEEGRNPANTNRSRTIRADPGRIDIVLEEVARDPSTSTRAISRRTGIPHVSVHRILRVERIHPYHIRKVQDLLPTDYQRRVDFCQEMLRRDAEDTNFFDKILWTDESKFTRSGIFNMHNYHSYARINPHQIRRQSFQTQFSVNLWAGILNRKLIGPFELPDTLNGERYLNFIQQDLPMLLGDVSILLRTQMFYQMDGAPCHFARAVRQELNQNYAGRWIGRGGPIVWPPRSPDLNPLDFFIWGFYKELVYCAEYQNIEELRSKLSEAQNEIRSQQDAFTNLRRNFLRRCRMCIAVGGRHFEHLL